MLTIADLHINSDVLDFNLLNTCLNFQFLRLAVYCLSFYSNKVKHNEYSVDTFTILHSSDLENRFPENFNL